MKEEESQDLAVESDQITDDTAIPVPTKPTNRWHNPIHTPPNPNTNPQEIIPRIPTQPPQQPPEVIPWVPKPIPQGFHLTCKPDATVYMRNQWPFTYNSALAIHWYWSQITWIKPTQQYHAASWIELAADFILSTGIQPTTARALTQHSLWDQADTFARATHTLGTLLKKPNHPGSADKNYHFTHLGPSNIRGLSYHATLKHPRTVAALLLIREGDYKKGKRQHIPPIPSPTSHDWHPSMPNLD